MRSLWSFVALLLAFQLFFSSPAAAGEEEEPEFLLSDVGVRVDLPAGWKMTRWSTLDLKAETGDPILLQAWSSEVQTDPDKVDPKVWRTIYDARLEEMGADAEAIKLKAATNATVQDRPAAFLDYSFKLKSGTPAVLKGATIAVEGQMFHLALVSVSRFDKKTDAARTELMDRLEIHQPPASVEWGPTLEGDGFSHALPSDWREPLKSETGLVNKQIANLGLEKLDGCWLAMRPKGPELPDAMVSCQGGLLLGVVDSYSFAGVEPTVRARMFGAAEVPAGRALELADRTGFVYDLHEKGLSVGVVPFDKGVVRTWVRSSGDSADLESTLEATLKGGTYGGAHPASLGDQVGYYVKYRPFSPVVLCPAISLLGVGGLLMVAALFLLGGRRDKYADLDDL